MSNPADRAARQISAREALEAEARMLPCPTCGAFGGDECTIPSNGEPFGTTHSSRDDAARDAREQSSFAAPSDADHLPRSWEDAYDRTDY